jgi:hypothetical protein
MLRLFFDISAIQQLITAYPTLVLHPSFSSYILHLSPHTSPSTQRTSRERMNRLVLFLTVVLAMASCVLAQTRPNLSETFELQGLVTLKQNNSLTYGRGTPATLVPLLCSPLPPRPLSDVLSSPCP